MGSTLGSLGWDYQAMLNGVLSPKNQGFNFHAKWGEAGSWVTD